MKRWVFGILIAAAWLVANVAALAQPPAAPTQASPDLPTEAPVAESRSGLGAGAAPGHRWLLLCCGLPGDDEHRERLTEACKKILAAADPVLDIGGERRRVLVADETMRDALGGSAGDVGICTKQTVARALDQLAAEVQPDDACWIVLLGHSQLYDSHSWFNVSGPDFDQNEFAKWSHPLDCREQVYWLTMPLSGFWTKPLASGSRVILTATEADLEFTGTEMPYALADVLAGDAVHQKLDDLDGQSAISLLDLYLATNLEIHGRFQAMERLQTEHAQLEDNGDGRGSELQEAYLPTTDDEGTETQPPPAEPIRSELLDGYRSQHIPLLAATEVTAVAATSPDHGR